MGYNGIKFKCEELESIVDLVKDLEKFSYTLEDKYIILKILNMNLFEIELKSREEYLSDLKKLYLRKVTALKNILKSYNSNIYDLDYEHFSNSFFAFLGFTFLLSYK